MNDADSRILASHARRMVAGHPVRPVDAPSLDAAMEIDQMSTDAQDQAPEPQAAQQAQTQRLAAEIASELHTLASYPQNVQAGGAAPEGAQAALGGLLGGVLTDALLAKIKGWSVEELTLLTQYLVQRLRVRMGELTGGF